MFTNTKENEHITTIARLVRILRNVKWMSFISISIQSEILNVLFNYIYIMRFTTIFFINIFEYHVGVDFIQFTNKVERIKLYKWFQSEQNLK